MEKTRRGYRIARKLLSYIPSFFLTSPFSWQWLRFYPAVIPNQNYFNQSNCASKTDIWHDYQTWINKNSLFTVDAWRILQQQAYHWQSPPKISLVTPVYNTEAHILYQCILSVRAQAYPYWQLILVDDGSSCTETHQLLNSGVCKDPRINVYLCQQSQGISKASNLAIEKAQGDYIIFLDHDDCLALDALFEVAQVIRQMPDIDIIYSDRDMISPKGERYMHLFKPNWSPETLLSGNYIFHLMCYRHRLLIQLGGYRAELDGSQDYDLILRAMETQPQVYHIQKVLYHWRQYQGSVSLDSDAKDYAFKAGISALNQALQRRGINGVANEIKSLWRGNYQLELDSPDLHEIEIISLATDLPMDSYTHQVNQLIQQTKTKKPFIALMSRTLTPVTDNAITHLAAWLKINSVGLASGRIMSVEKHIEYIGATYKKDGSLLIPYQGFPVSEIGYMAVTQLVRNISSPHPFCVLIRTDLWQQLGGLNHQYQGFYGLLDFALRALASHWRCVSVPQAEFITQQQGLLTNYSTHDQQLFKKQWLTWLEQGDPYYNTHLDRDNQARLFHLKLL